MTELPESEGTIAYPAGHYEAEWISSQDAYSESQMLAYGRAEYLRAIEDAAQVCLTDWSTSEEMAAGHVFYDAIRALAGEKT